MTPPTFFTAAEMGRCLQCSAQNVRKGLKAIAADAKKVVSGVETAAWQFGSLPSPFVVRLAKAATRYGFSTPLHYLQNAPRAERSRPSIAHVADTEIERAQKLQRALARCLVGLAARSTAELARIAEVDYRREFSHGVSDRHLRALIKRVIERDGGHLNFARLDLYLSARPAKRTIRPSPLARSFRFDELDAHFATLRDRTKPTPSEIAHSWREVIRFLADRLATDANETKLKRELRSYLLQAAPFMGNSASAIKRTLNRKLREAGRHGIDRITDGRLQAAPAGKRPSDFDAMIELLALHTTRCCGRRESQAYRQLHMGTTHNGDRFSEEFRAAYPFNCRTAKSRVPTCVRNAAQPRVAAMWADHLGSRARRLSMPSIHRDWDQVLAGDYYTSDDETLNHLIVDWHELGEYEFAGRRFNVVRPQVLPVVDERSGNPLGFSLAPAPTYNSWQIRTLFARVCMRPEIGLPFKGFAVERGIWESRNVEALSSWSQIDESFGRHGIRLSVRHATTPKAKVIEQIFSSLQNLDEYAPGYVGRAERSVKYERVHRFVQRLKRVGQPQKAEVDPTEMLMTTEECIEMLSTVMQRFADEPQNGERLNGLSPAEGWEQLSGSRMHNVLPEELGYLLATAESRQTVTTEGIVLRIGNRKHYYCGSEQLGALVGEKVCVRYNPELPEQVIVSHLASDPRAQRPFSVPLFERVHAHNATPNDFARARWDQKRFVSYGRALFRELTPKANATIQRIGVGSRELREAGKAHNRLERDYVELESEREAERGTIDRLATQQDLAIDSRKVRNPKRVAQHLRVVDKLKAKIRAAEAAAAGQLEATQ